MTGLARRLGALVALLALGACGAISALNDVDQPLDSYELGVPQGLPVARRSLPQHLTVERPAAGGALDTDRILIRPNPLQAQYLPAARWTDEAPVMLQTLILRSLEATGALTYVGRRPLGASSDYALLSEIAALEAAPLADGDAATVRVELSAWLVREEDAQIVADRTFTATASAPSTETLTLVAALDRATGQVLREIAAWTLATLGVAASAGG